VVVQIRTEAFARFESGESAVLVCTDAAARGLDITGVRLVHTTCVVPSSSRRLWCSQVRNVVLFDFPLNTTEYLHRVGASRPVGHHIRPNACPHHALTTGRTARAASKGTATSLITKRDRVLARAIMVRPTRSHPFTPTRLHAGTMLMHLAFCCTGSEQGRHGVRGPVIRPPRQCAASVRRRGCSARSLHLCAHAMCCWPCVWACHCLSQSGSGCTRPCPSCPSLSATTWLTTSSGSYPSSEAV